MGSTLNIQLDLQDYPKPPTIGILASERGTTHYVGLIAVHEPISTAGLARAVQQLVRAWIEPELSTKPTDQLDDLMTALGMRQL